MVFSGGALQRRPFKLKSSTPFEHLDQLKAKLRESFGLQRDVPLDIFLVNRDGGTLREGEQGEESSPVTSIAEVTTGSRIRVMPSVTAATSANSIATDEQQVTLRDERLDHPQLPEPLPEPALASGGADPVDPVVWPPRGATEVNGSAAVNERSSPLPVTFGRESTVLPRAVDDDLSKAEWQYKTEPVGIWKAFEKDEQLALATGKSAGHRTVVIATPHPIHTHDDGTLVEASGSGGTEYIVDLESMNMVEQSGQAQLKVRLLREKPAPPTALTMVAVRRRLDGDTAGTQQEAPSVDGEQAGMVIMAKVKWATSSVNEAAERVSLCELQYCRKNAMVWNTVRLGSPHGTEPDWNDDQPETLADSRALGAAKEIVGGSAAANSDGSSPATSKKSMTASFRASAAPTRDGDGGVPIPRSQDTGVPGEWATEVAGLALNKKYLLRVRAQNARGWSEWSDRVTTRLEFENGDEQDEEEEEIEVTIEGSGPLGIDYIWPQIENIRPGSLASQHPELVPGLELVRVAGQDIRGCDIETGGNLFRNAARPITLAFVKPMSAAKKQTGTLLAPPSAVRLVGSELVNATSTQQQSNTETSSPLTEGDRSPRATADLVWSCDSRASHCQLQYATKGFNKWVTVDVAARSQTSTAEQVVTQDYNWTRHRLHSSAYNHAPLF